MRGAIPPLTVQGRPAGNMLLARAVSYENRFYFFNIFDGKAGIEGRSNF